MTRIDFYTRVDDKLRFACRLCMKALSQQVRVALYAPDPTLAERLDALLWTTPSTGFLPHCRAEAALAPETPILICTTEPPLQHDELLINLDAASPPFFSRFHRLAEIVTATEDDAAQARARYRFYRDRGYPLASHDMGGTHE